MVASVAAVTTLLSLQGLHGSGSGDSASRAHADRAAPVESKPTNPIWSPVHIADVEPMAWEPGWRPEPPEPPPPPPTWLEDADPLDWLASHQGDDGFWRARDYALREDWHGVEYSELRPPLVERADRHRGDRSFDFVCTSLALFAFLNRFYTHQDNEYALTVRLALRALKKQQVKEGDRVGAFYDARSVDPIRDQAAAVVAVGAAYAQTWSSILKPLAVDGSTHLAALLVDAVDHEQLPSRDALALCVMAISYCGDSLRESIANVITLATRHGPSFGALVSAATWSRERPNVEIGLALTDRYPAELAATALLPRLEWWLVRSTADRISDGPYITAFDRAIGGMMLRSPDPRLTGSWEPTIADRVGGRLFATAMNAVLGYTTCCAFCFRDGFWDVPRHTRYRR